MKVEVRYYSRGGNTQKIADAIAERYGIKAKNTQVALDEKCDVLFLGSSLYAGSPNAEVLDFIKANADKIGKIALFGSSASGKSTYEKVKAAATACGVEISERFFNCPGKFLFMHKGRPNQRDLDNAVKFASSIAQ